MNLRGKYKEIWDLAVPYLINCRWYDLRHTEMSVDFMYQIMKGEGREDLEEILIPAIICHDIGYSVIGEEKNTFFNDHDMRVRHMKEGAELAKKILEKINYKKDLIVQIVHLILTHDNAY